MGFWNLMKLRLHRKLCLDAFKPIADTTNLFYAEQRKAIWRDPYVIGFFRGTYRTTLEAALAAKPVELTEFEKDTLFYQLYSDAAKHVSFDQAFAAVKSFQGEHKASLRRGYDDGKEVAAFVLTGNPSALDLTRDRTVEEHRMMLTTGYLQFLQGQGRAYDEIAALKEAAVKSTIHAHIDRHYRTTPLP